VRRRGGVRGAAPSGTDDQDGIATGGDDGTSADPQAPGDPQAQPQPPSDTSADPPPPAAAPSDPTAPPAPPPAPAPPPPPSDASAPPPEVLATLTPVYHEGHACYWWHGHWYYRNGAAWTYYHEEPAALRASHTNVVYHQYSR
jgi:hypothetical protein